MRHGNHNRKLSRKAGARRALLKLAAKNLIRDGKTATTLAKAKEIAPFVEKLVTLSKKEGRAAEKMVASRLSSNVAAHKIFTEISPKYKDRLGGYTRITKLPLRKSDGARMALIEFV